MQNRNIIRKTGAAMMFTKTPTTKLMTPAIIAIIPIVKVKIAFLMVRFC